MNADTTNKNINVPSKIITHFQFNSKVQKEIITNSSPTTQPISYKLAHLNQISSNLKKYSQKYNSIISITNKNTRNKQINRITTTIDRYTH